jgi:hypothetical protein
MTAAEVAVQAPANTTQNYLERLRATMESLTDSQPSFKGMIYGVSGVGKTVAAIQIAQEITPENKTIQYIDTAQGWVSLMNHQELITDRVKRMRYSNLRQIEALTLAIRLGADEFGDIGTVVFDESTSAADTALDEVLKYRASQDRSKDPDTPTQPDYNTTTNRVRKAFNELLTLEGVHVIFVAHARKDKDNRNIEVVSPSFLPKLGQKIKQPLHLIANLSGNEIDQKYVRIFQVHPTRTIDAKCRIGGLPPQVEYPILMRQMKGWLRGNVRTEPETQLVQDVDPENPSVNVVIEGE